jgi:hypothetical protein
MTSLSSIPTGWILAACSLIWGTLLWRRRRRATAIRWWAASFFVLGLASILAETTDGWVGTGPPTGTAWDATLVLFGLVAFCAAATAIASSIRRGQREPFYALGMLGLAGYLVLIAKNPGFVSAIAAYIVGLLLVLAQQSVAWVDRQARSARWIVAGILVNIVAVVVQFSLFGLQAPPSSMKLFHMLLIPGGWLLYRGGLRLSEP